MKNIVIISAHPDDETLGAGGTLLRHKELGDQIFWLITTNIFEDQGFSKEKVKSRQEEIGLIAKKIGIKKVYKLNYPTATLSSESLITMVPKISEVFKQCKPEIIYCLNRSDAHSDHRITFDAIMACTKSFRNPFIKKVFMYECLSETEFAASLPEKAFKPNCYIDISKYMKQKIDLMKIYSSELGEHPFPRSVRNIEALATFRGAYAGVEFAEAFQLLIYIDK